MLQHCKICKKKIVGRRDKLFCSIDCKNVYHYKLNQATKKVTGKVDSILHRNRSILLEICKRKKQIKVKREVLDDKNFKYDFITGFHTNSKNKFVHHVYDFSWLIFSDETVLIFRK